MKVAGQTEASTQETLGKFQLGYSPDFGACHGYDLMPPQMDQNTAALGDKLRTPRGESGRRGKSLETVENLFAVVVVVVVTRGSHRRDIKFGVFRHRSGKRNRHMNSDFREFRQRCWPKRYRVLSHLPDLKLILFYRFF